MPKEMVAQDGTGQDMTRGRLKLCRERMAYGPKAISYKLQCKGPCRPTGPNLVRGKGYAHKHTKLCLHQRIC